LGPLGVSLAEAEAIGVARTGARAHKSAIAADIVAMTTADDRTRVGRSIAVFLGLRGFISS
jgi:hypothetical protein